MNGVLASSFKMTAAQPLKLSSSTTGAASASPNTDSGLVAALLRVTTATAAAAVGAIDNSGQASMSDRDQDRCATYKVTVGKCPYSAAATTAALFLASLRAFHKLSRSGLTSSLTVSACPAVTALTVTALTKLPRVATPLPLLSPPYTHSTAGSSANVTVNAGSNVSGSGVTVADVTGLVLSVTTALSPSVSIAVTAAVAAAACAAGAMRDGSDSAKTPGSSPVFARTSSRSGKNTPRVARSPHDEDDVDDDNDNDEDDDDDNCVFTVPNGRRGRSAVRDGDGDSDDDDDDDAWHGQCIRCVCAVTVTRATAATSPPVSTASAASTPVKGKSKHNSAAAAAGAVSASTPTTKPFTPVKAATPSFAFKHTAKTSSSTASHTIGAVPRHQSQGKLVFPTCTCWLPSDAAAVAAAGTLAAAAVAAALLAPSPTPVYCWVTDPLSLPQSLMRCSPSASGSRSSGCLQSVPMALETARTLFGCGAIVSLTGAALGCEPYAAHTQFGPSVVSSSGSGNAAQSGFPALPARLPPAAAALVALAYATGARTERLRRIALKTLRLGKRTQKAALAAASAAPTAAASLARLSAFAPRNLTTPVKDLGDDSSLIGNGVKRRTVEVYGDVSLSTPSASLNDFSAQTSPDVMLAPPVAEAHSDTHRTNTTGVTSASASAAVLEDGLPGVSADNSKKQSAISAKPHAAVSLDSAFNAAASADAGAGAAGHLIRIKSSASKATHSLLLPTQQSQSGDDAALLQDTDAASVKSTEDAVLMKDGNTTSSKEDVVLLKDEADVAPMTKRARSATTKLTTTATAPSVSVPATAAATSLLQARRLAMYSPLRPALSAGAAAAAAAAASSNLLQMRRADMHTPSRAGQRATPRSQIHAAAKTPGVRQGQTSAGAGVSGSTNAVAYAASKVFGAQIAAAAASAAASVAAAVAATEATALTTCASDSSLSDAPANASDLATSAAVVLCSCDMIVTGKDAVTGLTTLAATSASHVTAITATAVAPALALAASVATTTNASDCFNPGVGLAQRALLGLGLSLAPAAAVADCVLDTALALQATTPAPAAASSSTTTAAAGGLLLVAPTPAKSGSLGTSSTNSQQQLLSEYPLLPTYTRAVTGSATAGSKVGVAARACLPLLASRLTQLLTPAARDNTGVSASVSNNTAFSGVGMGKLVSNRTLSGSIQIKSDDTGAYKGALTSSSTAASQNQQTVGSLSVVAPLAAAWAAVAAWAFTGSGAALFNAFHGSTLTTATTNALVRDKSSAANAATPRQAAARFYPGCGAAATARGVTGPAASASADCETVGAGAGLLLWLRLQALAPATNPLFDSSSYPYEQSTADSSSDNDDNLCRSAVAGAAFGAIAAASRIVLPQSQSPSQSQSRPQSQQPVISSIVTSDWQRHLSMTIASSLLSACPLVTNTQTISTSTLAALLYPPRPSSFFASGNSHVSNDTLSALCSEAVGAALAFSWSLLTAASSPFGSQQPESAESESDSVSPVLPVRVPSSIIVPWLTETLLSVTPGALQPGARNNPHSDSASASVVQLVLTAARCIVDIKPRESQQGLAVFAPIAHAVIEGLTKNAEDGATESGTSSRGMNDVSDDDDHNEDDDDHEDDNSEDKWCLSEELSSAAIALVSLLITTTSTPTTVTAATTDIDVARDYIATAVPLAIPMFTPKQDTAATSASASTPVSARDDSELHPQPSSQPRPFLTVVPPTVFTSTTHSKPAASAFASSFAIAFAPRTAIPTHALSAVTAALAAAVAAAPVAVALRRGPTAADAAAFSNAVTGTVFLSQLSPVAVAPGSAMYPRPATAEAGGSNSSAAAASQQLPWRVVAVQRSKAHPRARAVLMQGELGKMPQLTAANTVASTAAAGAASFAVDWAALVSNPLWDKTTFAHSFSQHDDVGVFERFRPYEATDIRFNNM